MITSFQFSIAGQPKDSLRLHCGTMLNGATAAALRAELNQYASMEFAAFYVDASDVEEADLSGINEIIHSHYTLHGENKKMVFIYRKKSVTDKWVHTTGLGTFVETALLPAL